SSFTVGTGSKTFITQAGLAYSAGARARVSNTVTPTTYMEGIVTSYSGTSLIINVDTTSGSGTLASWNINNAGNVGAQGSAGAQGNQGATGATGAGYLATASGSTNTTTASGTKTFTTQSGLAYTAGARVRATSTGTPADFTEGIVTSYSGTTLIFTADTAGGT